MTHPRSAALAACVLLLALAAAVGASGKLLLVLSGLRPLRAPIGLDLQSLGAREESDLAPFLVARDRLLFTVDRAVRVAEFRERYRLGQDPIREAETGARDLGEAERLVPGTTYVVALTPRRAGR